METPPGNRSSPGAHFNLASPVATETASTVDSTNLGQQLSPADWCRSSSGLVASPPYPISLPCHLAGLGEPVASLLLENYVHRQSPDGPGGSDATLGRGGDRDSNTSGSRFWKKSIPMISVHDYITRICNYAVAMEPNMMLAILIYAQRLEDDAAASGLAGRPRLMLDRHSIHRFIITSVCIASKAMGDLYYSNAFYAKVGGISAAELNLLELELAHRLDWRLQCSVEDLELAWKSLRPFMD